MAEAQGSRHGSIDPEATSPIAVAERQASPTRLLWWKEMLIIGAMYLVYSMIRNVTSGGQTLAGDHARSLIDLEKRLSIFVEIDVHKWAMHSKALIIVCNYFYGSLHFVVTIGVLVYLFRKHQTSYRRLVTTLQVVTVCALGVFATWPLMPPRLLGAQAGIHYGFVDTLLRYPTIWSFNSGGMQSVSNQYAAMPSLHCAWALWCACVLVPRLRRPWAKALAATYPAMTVFVIVATSNHYLLDAVAGFALVGIVWTLMARAPFVPWNRTEACATA